MGELHDRLSATTLGDQYTVKRELGRGGMATVYLAQDVKHRRQVALKVLHPELAHAMGTDRFLREVETGARLVHPHVLPVFDSGEVDGLLWYTMPYIDGESLRDRLRRERQLPLDDAIRIATEVADALSYAHGHGVVHRDIKPENILLSGSHALVADFGIAKAVALAGGERLTQTGSALGTPAYMSPEQAAGDAELDGRSDIYSLGCVLYEMLAGEPPFTGPTVRALMVKHFTDPVPSVSRLRPGVPERVERATTQALAKEPVDRFASASEFARALVEAPSGARSSRPVAQPAAAIGRSIAVLPFADMSAQHDQEYFTDGIAEEIINALTKVQALRVVSRSSAFAFKGKNQDIRQVGEQLNVSTVLEGSLRKAGNRLRITAQLINVADGYHLWSERYDRELEDVFAVQDEIAENIVRSLRVVLSEDEKRAIEQPRTDDVQAYEYYLRGRQFFHQFREKGLQFARRMFARAIEIDPNYARAYAGIADCSSILYHYWDASNANLEQADTASRKALELAPTLAEAHAARGLALSLRGRYDDAEREFDAATRLDPQLYEGHYYFALARFQQGNLAEAAKLFEQAAAVRPEDYQAPILAAQSYAGLGQHAMADAGYRRAAVTVERHIELNPDDPRALYMGANILCHIGRREQGLEWGDRALALDPEDAGVLYNTACLNAVAGRSEYAIELLEKAVQNGFGHREWIDNDPDVASLRDHPRFQALLNSL
jgi:serine/threonine protein kinase/Flp pilus assembly protein TadD